MTDDIDRSHHDHEHSPPGPHTLPEPPSRELKDGTILSIQDVYLGDIGDHDQLWMPLYVLRLRKSYFFELASNEQLGAALRLWIAGWIANPAASLKAEDRYLAKVAGYDLSLQHCLQYWLQYRDLIMHGWIRCSDGRMYHLDLAEIALDQAEKLNKRKNSMANARASLGKKRKKVLTQRTGQSSGQKTEQSSDLKSGTDRDGDLDREERKSPLTPASGGTRAEASLSAQEREAPASPAERGSATTEFADRPTSPPKDRSRDIDPEASAVRKQTMDNSSLKAEFGLTATEMLDAMHQACFGSNRLIANSPKLESAEAIIALMRDNPGVSFTLDVLPAIKARVSRAGDKIGSWAFFADAIRGWSQNRVSGTGSGRHDGPSGGQGYEAGNLPKWWRGWEDGEPPPGHPWPKRVIDERTRELRRYGGHWDWEWFDRVGKYQRTGEWDESFAKELPGRPSSSCPDDICAHYGIKPQARREGAPIINMKLVREVAAQRAREGRVAAPPMRQTDMAARVVACESQNAPGGLPTGLAGQAACDDDAPPF